MDRHVIALRYHIAVAIKNRAGIVAPLFDVRRIGRSFERRAHFFGDGMKQAFEDFELYGICSHWEGVPDVDAVIDRVYIGQKSVAGDFKVALGRTAGPGSGDHAIEGNRIGHLAIKHKVVHSAGLVFCIGFEMNCPFVDC